MAIELILKKMLLVLVLELLLKMMLLLELLLLLLMLLLLLELLKEHLGVVRDWEFVHLRSCREWKSGREKRKRETAEMRAEK